MMFPTVNRFNPRNVPVNPALGTRTTPFLLVTGGQSHAGLLESDRGTPHNQIESQFWIGWLCCGKRCKWTKPTAHSERTHRDVNTPELAGPCVRSATHLVGGAAEGETGSPEGAGGCAGVPGVPAGHRPRGAAAPHRRLRRPPQPPRHAPGHTFQACSSRRRRVDKRGWGPLVVMQLVS